MEKMLFLKGNKETLTDFFTVCGDWLGMRTDSKTTIAIDDFTILQDLGVSTSALVTFIDQLEEFCHSHNSNFVILSHTDCGLVKEEPIVQRYIAYKSSLVLSARALDTGRCKEIDGELTIKKGLTLNSSFQVFPSKMHFKVYETNVRVFPIGLK